MIMLEAWRERLEDLLGSPWLPLGTPALLVTLLAAVILALAYGLGSEGWIPLLDSVNLVFHEAGHPIFGLFGHTIGFLGGTLMQLLVPLLVMGSAFTKRQPLGVALSGIWVGQNFMNIARYVADARAEALPLVGGGEHDWGTLLGEWGLLQSDLRIAAGLRVVAWLIILGSCAWASWRWHQRQGA